MNGMQSQVLPPEQVSTQAMEASQPHCERCPLCGSSQIVPFLTAPDRFHLRRELYHLLRCSQCSGVWLASPPPPDQMGIHYDDDYHRAIMAGGETDALNRWRRHCELIARYKKSGAILDIGCSSGAFLSTFKGPSWRLHGLEMEASTADRARAASGAEVFVGDVDDAPFAPESFDVITAFDLLEHVYRPRQFLSNVRRWLKPGGIFFTMLPNIDSWESRLFGTYWYGLELPRHLFHFSPRSLRYTMLALGFQEVFHCTSAVSYAERSADYFYKEMLDRAGFSPAPQAKPTPESIAIRALRKMIRLTVVKPAGYLASLAGTGANMEAIFTKSAASDELAQNLDRE